MATFFARPLIKYGAIALGLVLLVAGVLFYIDGVRRDGKKAGAAAVTTAVQAEGVKKQEEARQDKTKAEEVVRNKPIDDVIEGLK